MLVCLLFFSIFRGKNNKEMRFYVIFGLVFAKNNNRVFKTTCVCNCWLKKQATVAQISVFMQLLVEKMANSCTPAPATLLTQSSYRRKLCYAKQNYKEDSYRQQDRRSNDSCFCEFPSSRFPAFCFLKSDKREDKAGKRTYSR